MKTTEHPTLTRLRAIAHEMGSTATTPKGIRDYLRRNGLQTSKMTHAQTIQARKDSAEVYHAHRALDRGKVGDVAMMPVAKIPGYGRLAWRDDVAASHSYDAMMKANPRKQNFSMGGPKKYGAAYGWDEEAIHYKGAYKGYTGSHLTSRYQSCVCVSKRGRVAVWVLGNVITRRRLAPAGMRWHIGGKQTGLWIERTSDGMDYHPTADDIRAKDFAGRVRRAMAQNYKLRQEAKRREREVKHTLAIFQRDIATTRVLLEDSRRAGNCVAGSLAFAETRLGVPREQILAAPALTAVRAAALMRTGDKRAESAVRCAWERETLVSI